MPTAAEPARSPVASIGTTEQLRRNNLSNILGLVHQSGPLSRAQLTRRTGLNRSTVGAVVADLADLRLVYEGIPERSAKAGRPSPVVHVDRGTGAIAVNPEVDAVHVGLVGLGGRVLEQVRVETANTPSAEQVVELATTAIADLLSRESLGTRRSRRLRRRPAPRSSSSRRASSRSARRPARCSTPMPLRTSWSTTRATPLRACCPARVCWSTSTAP